MQKLTREFKYLTLSLMILATTLSSIPTEAQPPRKVSEYNLQNGVGLMGFDPVAVFPEGGGVAKQGSSSLSLVYLQVTYHFATQQNRDLFMQQPEKFEPTYGGWCAYAMASGSKVDIQPQLFTIHGNRAHFFVSARAKQNFDRDVLGFETRADEFWKMFSGEEPRL